MKAIAALFLCLSLSACSYFSSDLTYKDARGSIVLKQTPCKMEGLSDNPDMKGAEVKIEGQPVIKGCWTDGGKIDPSAASTYFVIAENGGYALFPKDKFK